MFANWLLVTISIGYISLLFLIAYLGGKYRHKLAARHHTIIYALSLGVYCTSWGFLGTAAQAANHSFTYLSVYLAPILLFVFAWPFIQRIMKISLQLKITSIADLLSARFGKSQNLAVLITVVALIGTMPYIALQLKAIAYSYQILQENQDLPIWQIGLIVSIILAGFTIIFGIRTIDITERHPGVMIAIAFESLIKLIAFLLVGLFISFYIYDSPIEIWHLSKEYTSLTQQFQLNNMLSMLGMLIIVMSAFLCLPRQFQVLFVEVKNQKNSQLGRWLLPLYIIVFAFFAAPLGLAGNLLYGDSLPTDSYVLFLPAFNGQMWMSLLSFLGAISAASSMVIVSTIALSTMLSNEIIFPLMFKFSRQQHENFSLFQSQLLLIRKLLVVLVIFLSYGMLLLSPPDTLSSLGEVAFGAIAQIGPVLAAAFFWRRATLIGALSGISAGFLIWISLNLLPQLGIYDNPLINSKLPATTAVTLLGLVVNILVLWFVSLLTRQSIREQMQCEFFYPSKKKKILRKSKQPKININELEFLVGRFIGYDKAKQSFIEFKQEYGHIKQNKFNEVLMFHTENILASVLGSASAKIVTSFAVNHSDIDFNQIAKLVEDNSTQQFEFSRTVLQSAIENASEGISVIDDNLKLVAWNNRYLEIFNYPVDLIYIGCPISQLIHYNLSHQSDFIRDIDQQVKKRLNFIRQGSRHSTERTLPNSKIIHIEGNPIPGGGFVMIFSDITIYRQAEKVLKEKNYDLEALILARTFELEQANKELELANKDITLAREKAEQAHFKKSQYLKACSHDLLQPLSAARLFSSAITLSSRVSEHERQQIKQIDNSLSIANDLLLDLNEVAQIESGNILPSISVMSIKELFDPIISEFSVLTNEYQIDFHYQISQLFIESDSKLLSRIIQNLLSNAFRYGHQGKVLLGVRRKEKTISIQIIDNGSGIPKDKQQEVFEQFTQLATTPYVGRKGLGLGLNIARSLANILEYQINLTSKVGYGCLFSIEVPLAQKKPPMIKPSVQAHLTLQGVGVLCIDNEVEVLAGMKDLLEAWKCRVFTAGSIDQAKAVFQQYEDQIDILLVDYQLEERVNDKYTTLDGISLITHIRQQSNYPLPAILITATTDADVVLRTEQNNIGYLRKIIKPVALRALMSALLTQKLTQNYSH